MRRLRHLVLLAGLLSPACVEPEGDDAVAPPDEDFALSAARRDGQTYDDSVAENHAALDKGKADGTSIVYDRQMWATQVDPSYLPQWTTQELLAGFALVRDTRFMGGVPPAQLPRRPSFLYPDDGCFARARAMDYLLESAGYPRPLSVFSFGDLAVATDNHANGEVHWWFHVAPIVGVNGVAFVLDPSLDPRQPRTVADWVAMQSGGRLDRTGVSICSGYVFSPDGNCDAAPDWENGGRIASEEYWYLTYEWNRQLELGRDPWTVLGDFPPWAL